MHRKQQFCNSLTRTISGLATVALATATVLALTVFLTQPAQAQTLPAAAWMEKVLHNFNNNGTDGYYPRASLISDAAGNLYGTTIYGSTDGVGTVFELTPTTGGGWTEQVLHSFGNGTDGGEPRASLIFDAAGNLYGTTYGGGIYCHSIGGCGTVFELTLTAGGNWTEAVLYNFGSFTDDGYEPSASLIFDAAGNLYGTTQFGGIHGWGTVFELTPTTGGGWSEQVLYNFCAQTNCSTDGFLPSAGLIFDAAGNLYGTTTLGGTDGVGTVFELTPTGGGGWSEQVLLNFGTGGAFPQAGLIFDAAGNLYGTTSEGGTNIGTVFELTPNVGGGWTETVLHNFGSGTDGSYPYAGLIFDAAGNLYGTTQYGGTYNSCSGGCGTVFELTPTAGGKWTEQVLLNFNGTGGANPYAGLIFDAAGHLYGTTQLTYYNCSGFYCGTVFELMPIYASCTRCSPSDSRESGVPPADRKDVLEPNWIERP